MSAESKIIVQKFGGSSLASAALFRQAARRVLAAQDRGLRPLVVVSAMAGETDRLLQLGEQFSVPFGDVRGRELDLLAASGEQVSAALMALAIIEQGRPARSFTAYQIRVLTDSRFQRARIRSIDAKELLSTLDQGVIPVVTGFQGVDHQGNLLTLGRGGSDTTAVAFAVVTGACCCEINKDVDGIYTADPRICPTARKLSRITCEEMLELSSMGTKALQIRSVELAMKKSMEIHVRSSFDDSEGTRVVPKPDEDLEAVVVTGLAHQDGQAKVSVLGLPDSPDSLAVVLGPLAQDDISVDFITQNIGSDHRMSVAFTIDAKLIEPALASLRRNLPVSDAGPLKIEVQKALAKVTAVGIGMRTHAGVAYRFFSALTREAIPIHMALSTEIKVSCLIPSDDCKRAVQILHQEFFP